MVRLNETQNFQFPFVKNSNQPTLDLSSKKKGKRDRYLSIFATSFFLVILLFIPMDSSNFNIQSSNNTITRSSTLAQQSSFASPQLASFTPFASIFPTSSSSNKTKDLKTKSAIVKKQVSKKVINSTPEILIETIIPIAKVKKVTSSPKPIFISSKNTTTKFAVKKVKTVSLPTVNRKEPTSNLTPKSVSLNKSPTTAPTNKLVINTKVTEDLLPNTFFEAKANAASEGKLLYLKFGAKWCLPCRQMEETTLKDETVKDILNKNYIQFSVDVDDFDGVNMQSYFNIKQLPAQLIFDSNGKFLAQYDNFTSANKLKDILTKHSNIIQKTTVTTEKEIIEKPVSSLEIAPLKVETSPYVIFDKIVLKKTKNGIPIRSLKNKAKNWRHTSIDFTLHNVNEGDIILKVKETQSGKILEEKQIPVVSNSRITDTTTTDIEDTDTTTTNFQLDLSHEKRKKKDGEYTVELYHSYQNISRLIGTTTIIKDGLILF